MMTLIELKFERSKYESKFPNNPLKGTATFMTTGEYQDAAIHISLTNEQVNRILHICRESIQDAVRQGLESVQNLQLPGDNIPKLEA